MKNILLSLMMALLFAGCFDAKPKCDDEDVQLTLKSILDDDEWVYVEYGLSEQSLKALRLSTNGMDIRDFEAILSTDTLGVLKAHLKPMFDLKDYANEVVYTSFSGFTTQDGNNKNTSFCRTFRSLVFRQ